MDSRLVLGLEKCPMILIGDLRQACRPCESCILASLDLLRCERIDTDASEFTDDVSTMRSLYDTRYPCIHISVRRFREEHSYR